MRTTCNKVYWHAEQQACVRDYTTATIASKILLPTWHFVKCQVGKRSKTIGKSKGLSRIRSSRLSTTPVTSNYVRIGGKRKSNIGSAARTLLCAKFVATYYSLFCSWVMSSIISFIFSLFRCQAKFLTYYCWSDMLLLRVRKWSLSIIFLMCVV